jgi:hypothetical protein
MRKEKQEAFQNIVDCFTGEDGGVKFAFVKKRFDEIDKTAIEGDKASQEIMEIMVRFSRLINVLGELK